MMLPASWMECHLDDLCSRIVDGSHNPPPAVQTGQPMLSARNIGFDEIFFDEFRLISSDKFEIEDTRTRIRSGTVLLTIVGALGRSAVVKDEHCIFTVQRSVGVLHANRSIEPSYLKRVFDCSWAQRWFQDHARGTAQRGVYLATLGEFPVPLPPLAEQRRIVTKLNALTARIARIRAELERVTAFAGRLRQTSLQEVFSDANLIRWQSVRFGDTVSDGLIGLVRSKLEQGQNGVPYLRMGHYDFDGKFNDDNLTMVSCTPIELVRFELQAGDILFNTRNSSDLVGKVALWPADKSGWVFNNNIMRLRFTRSLISSFVFRYMGSRKFRELMAAVKSSTTSVAAIYQRSLYAAPIPVPTLDEQRRVMIGLEAAFARADRLDTEAARATKLLDRLESAILAKAFRGELVPQDPADEPASVLLDRIRGAAPKPQRGRRAAGAT